MISSWFLSGFITWFPRPVPALPRRFGPFHFHRELPGCGLTVRAARMLASKILLSPEFSQSFNIGYCVGFGHTSPIPLCTAFQQRTDSPASCDDQARPETEGTPSDPFRLFSTQSDVSGPGRVRTPPILANRKRLSHLNFSQPGRDRVGCGIAPNSLLAGDRSRTRQRDSRAQKRASERFPPRICGGPFRLAGWAEKLS